MTNGPRTKTVAVCGATGRQGGAVARALLSDGANVRALTRKPQTPRARALAALGAEVVAADMEHTTSLRSAFAGADGVFSVQNGMVSGFEAEVRQGQNVADAARDAEVTHLVYTSAGPSIRATGVPSWEAKFRVEDHVRSLGLNATVLRPTAFMELMTEKAFYPPVAVWRLMPALMGEDRPVPWLAVDDVGAIASRVFKEAENFIGREIVLAGDIQSVNQCRELYREILGRSPRSFPMPTRLFDRFTKGDLTKMWRWLGANDLPLDTAETAALLPQVMTVREWLVRHRQVGARAPSTP